MTRRTKGQRRYLELLRDPRWQRVRLGVLERAGWRCEVCGTGDLNLQVHHGYYERGLLPWEYPDEALSCVCDACHADAEATKLAGYRALGLIHPKYQADAVALLRELRVLIVSGKASGAVGELRVEKVDGA